MISNFKKSKLTSMSKKLEIRKNKLKFGLWNDKHKWSIWIPIFKNLRLRFKRFHYKFLKLKRKILVWNKNSYKLSTNKPKKKRGGK